MRGPEYLTVKEAAAMLRCDHKTIRSEITRGRLPAVQVGRVLRIRRDHIDERLAVSTRVDSPHFRTSSEMRTREPVGEFTRLARDYETTTTERNPS
jgi:excisionase family DNA binding protein